MFGAEITVGGSSNTANGQQGVIRCVKATTGVPNSFYDQLGANISSAAGNIRLAAYDTVSSEPENLYSETGSVASATGFPVHSVTEFMLVTSDFWIAVQHDNVSNTIYYTEAGSPVEYQKNHTYGPAPNPITPDSGPNTLGYNLKAKHS